MSPKKSLQKKVFESVLSLPEKKNSVSKESKKSSLSPHTRYEHIKHLIQRSQIILLLLVVGIFLVVGSSLFLYYYLTNSKFLNFLPASTEVAIHIPLQKGEVQLYNSVRSFLPIPLDADIITASGDAGFRSITFFQNEKQFSGILLEPASLEKTRIFLSALALNPSDVKEEIPGEISVHSKKNISCFPQGGVVLCAFSPQAKEAYKQEGALHDQTILDGMSTIPHSSGVTLFVSSAYLRPPFILAHKESVRYAFINLTAYRDHTIRLHLSTINDPELTSQKSSPRLSENFVSYFPEMTTFVFSGTHFSDDWSHLESYYQKKFPEYALILKGVLAKKIQTFFGNDIVFERDILPILDSQYAFGLMPDSSKNLQVLFLAEGDKTVLVSRLMNAFFERRGQFLVDTKTAEIAKDTVLSLVYANPQKFQKREEEYESYHISGYEVVGTGYGLYSVYANGKTMVTSSLPYLKSSLSTRDRVSLTSYFPQELSEASEYGFISFDTIRSLSKMMSVTFSDIAPLVSIKNIAFESMSYSGGMSLVGNITLEQKK